MHNKFNKINKIKLLAQIELALESYRTGSRLKRHTHKTKSCKSLERDYHASPSLDRAWDTLQIYNSQFLTNYYAHAHFSIAASRLKYAGMQQQLTMNDPVPDHTTHMIYAPPRKNTFSPAITTQQISHSYQFVQFPQLQRLRFICTYQKNTAFNFIFVFQINKLDFVNCKKLKPRQAISTKLYKHSLINYSNGMQELGSCIIPRIRRPFDGLLAILPPGPRIRRWVSLPFALRSLHVTDRH